LLLLEVIGEAEKEHNALIQKWYTMDLCCTWSLHRFPVDGFQTSLFTLIKTIIWTPCILTKNVFSAFNGNVMKIKLSISLVSAWTVVTVIYGKTPYHRTVYSTALMPPLHLIPTYYSQLPFIFF